MPKDCDQYHRYLQRLFLLKPTRSPRLGHINIRVFFCSLLISLAVMIYPKNAMAQQDDPREWRRCELGSTQLDKDLSPIMQSEKVALPKNSAVPAMKLSLVGIKAQIDVFDIHCKKLAGYTESRASYQTHFDQVVNTCKQVASAASECVPAFKFTPATVGYDGVIISAATFGTRASGSTPPEFGTAKPAQSSAAPAAPISPNHPTSSLTPAGVKLTQQQLRILDNVSLITDSHNSIISTLSPEKKQLQERWKVSALLSEMNRMTAPVARTIFRDQYMDLEKASTETRTACKAVSTKEFFGCQGAFFGSSEQRTKLEYARNITIPLTTSTNPKLKRVPANAVSHCLTIDIKSLFGGFINNCDFAIMFVYCVENPPKSAWSDAFRCGRAGGINALDIVRENMSIGAHTHGGRVIFFACAWQSKSGEGPDGIWGSTIYNEGVGTPGVIRGTCGEQVYVP